MSGLLKFLTAVAVGLAAGYLSATYMAGGHAFSGAVRLGAWTVWPQSGREDASPYSRLHFLMRGQLPPSHFNRLEFEATEDDAGDPLEAACTYRIVSNALPARWWALTLYPEQAVRQGRFDGIREISSRTAILARDGSATFYISRLPRPGNWLQAPSEGRFVLVFRLFGATPLAREKLLSSPPARIVREGCR